MARTSSRLAPSLSRHPAHGHTRWHRPTCPGVAPDDPAAGPAIRAVAFLGGREHGAGVEIDRDTFRALRSAVDPEADHRFFNFRFGGFRLRFAPHRPSGPKHTPFSVYDQETAAHPLPREGPRKNRRFLPGRARAGNKRRARPRAGARNWVFFKAPGSDEEIEICKFDESGPVQVGARSDPPGVRGRGPGKVRRRRCRQGLSAQRWSSPQQQRQHHRFSRTRRRATKSS